MATRPPPSAWKWLMKRVNSTVFGDIWPELVLFSGIATMVVCVEKFTPTNMEVPSQLLTSLGTVLGLVISFRTSSAYDHYWEGRKLWGNIILHSRNLGQLLWIHVPMDRPPKKDEEGTPVDKNTARLKAIIERKTMINLVQAFSVSVKHYLRSEPGIYYEDLYPLIAALPQDVTLDSNRRRPISNLDTLPLFQDAGDPNEKTKKHKRSDSDHERLLPDADKRFQLKPARNPPEETIYYYLPILILFRPIWLGIRKLFKKPVRESIYDGPDAFTRTRTLWGKKRRLPPIESNIPLEITLFLSGYINHLLVKTLLIHPSANACLNCITGLQDSMAGLERVRTTPIPFAYRTHLRMCIWLYLFFLPFQIYKEFGWLTIPANFLATFLYVGFLEIGTEIENPFDYDENDLDLDHFCLTIQRELAEVVAHPAFDPSLYVFSSWNQPFAPGDRRTAEEIVSQVDHDYHSEDDGIRSVRRTLLRSFREISELTAVEIRKDDE